MRRILITKEIERIAKKYADEMSKGENLSRKPIDNLNNLKAQMESASTHLYFKSGKKCSTSGRVKKHYKSSDFPKYAEYIQKIIDEYATINNLHPRKYDALIRDMEGILAKKDLTVSVKVGKGKWMSFANHIVKAMDYDGVRETVFRQYIKDEAIDIKSCVYCNAQFAVTSVLEPAVTPDDVKRMKGRGRHPRPKPAKLSATYDLDHNKPKDKYPYLCTNFYNLQPCCSSCNRHKNDIEIDFNVYCWDSEEPKPLYFELSPWDLIRFSVYNQCGKMTPILHDKVGGKLVEQFNDRFSINAIYEEYADEVQELLWHYRIYSKSNMDVLNNRLSGLFSDGFDIERFIYGAYIEDKDAHKRPLSIMKQDLIEQLKREGL